MKIDDGGPARGMSLRDWFAGQALAGLLAKGQFTELSTVYLRHYKDVDPFDSACNGVAVIARNMADALLADLKKSGGET